MSTRTGPASSGTSVEPVSVRRAEHMSVRIGLSTVTAPAIVLSGGVS